ncbi:MAG: hypothetical protein AAFS10_06465, partial [Myxococcota bacterium]
MSKRSHNHRTLLGVAILAVTAHVALGCKTDNPAFNPDPASSNSSTESNGSVSTTCPGGADPITEEFTSLADPAQLDVLVVVSDAPESEPLQARLSEAMPALVQELTREGIDFQIGFITGNTDNQASAG